MPLYAIRRDSIGPEMATRNSMATTISEFSDDYNGPYATGGVAKVPPLRIQKSQQSSLHVEPQPQIQDYGQKVRTSRLPIFNQVRSMLHKPPNLRTTSGNIKWDEYSGEISENGKDPQVNPATFRSAYEGTFKVQRRSPERRTKPTRRGSDSPVSMLKDEDMGYSVQITGGQRGQRADSPVSPVSVSPHPDSRTDYISGNELSLPEIIPAPAIKVIKRKPAPNTPNLARAKFSPENSPSQTRGWGSSQFYSPQTNLQSRFSWTTAALSDAPRQSTDTTMTGQNRTSQGDLLPSSRFSWTTVDTSNTHPVRIDSIPHSPPPPVPSKYATPPVQSILSRGRPIQRFDRETRTPESGRSSTDPSDTATQTSGAGTSTWSAAVAQQVSESENSAGGKKLPLPPELVSVRKPLTHLEYLLLREQDIVRQRRNIEKMIFDNAKIERSSPIELPFSAYKDAQKKLVEHQAMLAEVKLEERQIGIAISRARRKEGEEEGLWVRRVTG